MIRQLNLHSTFKFIGCQLIISLLLLLCTPSAYSQFEKDFSPSVIDDTIPHDILDFLKAHLERDKESSKESKPKVNDFIMEIYEKRFEYLVKSFDSDYMMVSSSLSEHLELLTNNILESNPQIPRDVKIFPYRSDVPNALSYGNGVMAVMLGLLTKLENDDQVVFTLCHELAHQYLKHSAARITEIAKLNYDKDLKKKFNQAKNSQYNSYSKLKELMTSVDISLNKHGRDHEFEADSLGLVFYLNTPLNTPFNPSSPIRCMEIFDSVDISPNEGLIDLKKHFDFKEYKFKDTWQAYSSSGMWHKQRVLSDSGKTHPSCTKRAAALSRQLVKAGKSVVVERPPIKYKIATLAKFELIESQYHLKEYGKALFNSLLLMNDYPDNVYLQAMAGKCLFQLFVHQKKHELGKVLALPDPRYPENYNRMLTFIHKLRLTELAAISYYYTITKPADNFKNEHFLYTAWLVSFLDISQLDAGSVKEDYMSQFPNGKYKKEMKATPKF